MENNEDEEYNRCKNDPYYLYQNYIEGANPNISREDYEAMYNMTRPKLKYRSSGMPVGKCIITSTPSYFWDLYKKMIE